MNADSLARTIQLILAPVVMVSACAITLTGLLAHYSAINDRLRAMTRERLELLRAPGQGFAAAIAAADAFTAERLAQIDAQAPGLLRRHRTMRNAVLAIYSAVLVFILDMFVIALSAATTSDAVAMAALLTFLVGTSLFMVGALLTVLEVRVSHVAMHYETERVLKLGR